MRLSSVLAFIFDIDGTLVDSNELHVDSWTAHSGDSINNFLENNYAHRSAKDLINIYLNFSPGRRSTVSAKIWMDTDPSCSEKNIFQRSDRSRRCANFSSAFTTITNKSCSPVRAKRVTPNITSAC